MANPEHVNVVRGRTASVQSWCDANPGECLDLANADLRGIQLEGSSLCGANCEGAMLCEAVLTGADLSGAWLVGADLSDSMLVECNLAGVVACGANLRRSRLSRADLRAADLSNAFLNGADLSGARCGGTIWSGRELSLTLGLDEIVHLGPDFIDFDSIILSAGVWPVAFLRGCGVPEELIALLPEFADDAMHLERAVVWFVEEDAEFAAQLILALRQRGVRCWPAAASTVQHTRDVLRWRIGRTDALILCLSSVAIDYPQLELEIHSALLRETHPSGIEEPRRPILKLLDIDGACAADTLPSTLSELSDRVIAEFVDTTGNEKSFRAGIEQVLQSLTIPPSADSVVVPPIASGQYVVSQRQKPTECEAISLEEFESRPGQTVGIISGFRRLLRNDGGNSVWFDYRGDKQPTHHLRQLSAGNVLEWETAPVPTDLGRSLACFVWAGSFGAFDEPETEGFSLRVRGEDELVFNLSHETHLWKNSAGTVALLFVPRWTSPKDASGFFYLGLSPDMVSPGKTCRIGVRTVGIDSERWVGVNPVQDPVERQDHSAVDDRKNDE